MNCDISFLPCICCIQFIPCNWIKNLNLHYCREKNLCTCTWKNNSLRHFQLQFLFLLSTHGLTTYCIWISIPYKNLGGLHYIQAKTWLFKKCKTKQNAQIINLGVHDTGHIALTIPQEDTGTCWLEPYTATFEPVFW